VVAYPVLVAEKNDTDAVGPTVIRSTSGYWLTGALTIVVIIFSIDATVRGDLGYFLATMPWELLAIWLLFVTLVRPRILVYPGRLRVINLLRSHDIAWSAIGHLGGRYQLIISLQDGRKISCWGAPATGLDHTSNLDLSAAGGYASSRLNARRARRARRTKGATTSEMITAIMKDSGPGYALPQTAVATFWDRWVIVTSIVLIALCVIDGVVAAYAH
jgi:hypothetical protein